MLTKNKYFTDKTVTLIIEPKGKKGSMIEFIMLQDGKEVFRRTLNSKSYNQLEFVKLSKYQTETKIKIKYEKIKP